MVLYAFLLEPLTYLAPKDLIVPNHCSSLYAPFGAETAMLISWAREKCVTTFTIPLRLQTCLMRCMVLPCFRILHQRWYTQRYDMIYCGDLSGSHTMHEWV